MKIKEKTRPVTTVALSSDSRCVVADPVTPTPDEPMLWALDFDDCLDGVHGEWWKQRAWQHADEFMLTEHG